MKLDSNSKEMDQKSSSKLDKQQQKQEKLRLEREAKENKRREKERLEREKREQKEREKQKKKGGVPLSATTSAINRASNQDLASIPNSKSDNLLSKKNSTSSTNQPAKAQIPKG